MDGQLKMAELSAEAPLAPSEEWSDFSDAVVQQGSDNGNNISGPPGSTTSMTATPRRNKALDNVKKMELTMSNMADQYGETGSELASLSTSLEDLVNTFDDQITKCFRDLDQTTEQLAPVQIRNQDDIINESQYVSRLVVIISPKVVDDEGNHASLHVDESFDRTNRRLLMNKSALKKS